MLKHKRERERERENILDVGLQFLSEHQSNGAREMERKGKEYFRHKKRNILGQKNWVTTVHLLRHCSSGFN